MAETVQIAESIFKDLVWDNVVRAGLAALFSAMPFLAVWPIGPTVTYIVTVFSQKLFDALKLTVDLEMISFVNAEHKKAYDSALVKLMIIAHKKGIDSDEFKQAKEEAQAALSQFIHIGK